jgi:putative solute:sodium symporter small subunit
MSIGLEDEGFDKIMRSLLQTSLIQVKKGNFNEDLKSELPKVMELYLIHNQSFLTDFQFLGFPFHYWYTAQFLLILFVLLCLYYAVSIDKMNKEYDFVEET